MTSSEAPDRPAAAGVFVVRDPEVCAALETMLAPHRTDHSPADNGPAAVEALLADAAARVSELTGIPTAVLPEALPTAPTVEDLLDLAYTEGTVAGQQKAASEGREWSERQTSLVSGLEKQVEQLQFDLATAVEQLKASRNLHKQARSEADELQDSKHALETDLAHAQKLLDDLDAELEKVKASTPTGPKPLDGRTARGKDRKAFLDLADRMERQALTQPKDRAAVLRVAAQGVRDEIATVYGDTGKKAS